MSRDYVDSFKDGLSVVGRMAARGVGSLSRQMKNEEGSGPVNDARTGLYYQRHLVSSFGGMVPRVQFLEPVGTRRLAGGFVSKLVRKAPDKALAGAVYSMFFGDFQGAMEKIHRAISMEPQLTDAYFMAGCLEMDQGKFESAGEYFSRCRLLPQGLGQKLGRFFPSFQMTLCISDNLSFRFCPDVPGLNLLLALSYQNAHQSQMAVETLEQFLSVMPDMPELLMFLCLFYYQQENDKKIIEMLKEIVPVSHDGIIMAQILVLSWLRRGNPAVAEGILKKALESPEIDPHLWADLQGLMARVVREQGRVAEGAGFESKVKKLFPDHQDLMARLGIRDMEQKHLLGRESVGKRLSADSVPVESEVSRHGTDKKPDRETRDDIRLVSRDGKVGMPLPESLTIGREEGDLIMEWDTSLSSVHARIYRQKDQVWVEDLGSTNGTWINQHRISSRRILNRGDVLLAGQTELFLE